MTRFTYKKCFLGCNVNANLKVEAQAGKRGDLEVHYQPSLCERPWFCEDEGRFPRLLGSSRAKKDLLDDWGEERRHRKFQEGRMGEWQ